MRRIANSTRKIDANGAGKDGFSSGSLATQEPATIVDPQWLNDVQEEICNVIALSEATIAPITVDPGDSRRNQMALALQLYISDLAYGAAESARAGAQRDTSKRLLTMAVENAVKRAPGGTYTGTFLGAFYSPVTRRFFAFGQSGAIHGSQGVGAHQIGNWAISPPAASFTGLFNAGCYAANSSSASTRLILVGSSGEIQTSPDDASPVWTKRTPASGYTGAFRGVCTGPSGVVAVGASAAIQTSANGIAWTSRTPAGGYAGAFTAVTFCQFSGGGLYVAVGTGGEVQTSPDGVNWTRRAISGVTGGDFLSVAFGGGYAAITGSATGASSTFVSSDGVTWSSVPVSGTYSCAAYSGAAGRFIIAGTSDVVTTFSPDGTLVHAFNTVLETSIVTGLASGGTNDDMVVMVSQLGGIYTSMLIPSA